MRFRSTPQPSPEHWSKDYVEHLRTVHFALVTVCLGLILILSSKRYGTKAAAEQMTEVLQINALWPNDQLTTNAPRVPEHEVASTGSLNPNPTSFRAMAADHRIFLFQIQQPNLFVCRAGIASKDQDSYKKVTGKTWPTNMRGFAAQWDSLATHPLIVDSVIKITASGEMIDFYSLNLKSVPMSLVKPTSKKTTQDLGPVFLSMEGKPCQREFVNSPIDLVGSWRDLYFTFQVISVNRLTISQADLIESASIEPARANEIFGKDIFKRTEPNLELTASFRDAYPDLSQATADRPLMDFGTLAPQIYAEATTGNESFEAFGIKFPSELVTRWGFVLLIGVQLYLFMYLRRLSDNLDPEDPGWDSPWFAMDTSWLARSLLFVSLVVLPSVTELEMMVRSFTLKSHHPFLDMYPVFMAFCISVGLSILCWKYRPKLTEAVAPAQLFE